jgi:hypothetical protein
MDWLKDLVGQKKEIPVKRASVTKRTSAEKRFHVRNSDKKILIAHKSPTGNGYVYKTKTDKGDTRNVHVNGNLYKTREEAEKKVERLKKQEKH